MGGGVGSLLNPRLLGAYISLIGPDGSFLLTEACKLEVPGSNSGRAGYLSSWLCIYAPCSKLFKGMT